MTESQQNSKLYLYLNYNEQAELAENEIENVAENLFLQAQDTMTYFWGFLINKITALHFNRDFKKTCVISFCDFRRNDADWVEKSMGMRLYNQSINCQCDVGVAFFHRVLSADFKVSKLQHEQP